MRSLVRLSHHTPTVDTSSSHPARPQRTASTAHNLFLRLALVLVATVAVIHNSVIGLLLGIVTMRASSARKIQRADRLLRVGYYDLERTLGKGNFAVVRLGIHRLTRTKVAVKIVDKTDIDPDNLQKIWREIEIMRQLAHPHIIQLYQAVLRIRDPVPFFDPWIRDG
jgi:serine/threonine protein kinase